MVNLNISKNMDKLNISCRREKKGFFSFFVTDHTPECSKGPFKTFDLDYGLENIENKKAIRPKFLL